MWASTRIKKNGGGWAHYMIEEFPREWHVFTSNDGMVSHLTRPQAYSYRDRTEGIYLWLVNLRKERSISRNINEETEDIQQKLLKVGFLFTVLNCYMHETIQAWLKSNQKSSVWHNYQSMNDLSRHRARFMDERESRRYIEHVSINDHTPVTNFERL